MAPSKLSNLGNALYHVIFLLSMNEPCPIASFSPSVTPKNARSFPLTAYINPDGGGSNLGGRESLRNNTISEVAFVQTAINIEIDDKDSDIVGPGTLGDIMAGSSASDNAGRNNNANAILSQTAVIDGLVTKEGGELNAKFGCRFSPMERIALTANGNLQRIFSSYYDAPVHVHVDSCTRREGVPRENTNPQTVLDGFAFRIDTNGAVWDRVVHLYVHETTLCKATSIIHVRSTECVKLIEDGTIGLGQLFRYLNKLPTFKLLDAGRTQEPEQSAIYDSEGGMWRIYELQCEEMTCLIHEEFHRDAWNIVSAGSGDVL